MRSTTDAAGPRRFALAVVGIVVFSIGWLAQSLFFQQVFPKGDLTVHLRWASEFAALLREGWLVPRWTYASHLGLGDPTFLYYQPLFYYFASALASLGLPVERAVFWTAWTPYCLLGIVFLATLRKYDRTLARAIVVAFVVVDPAMFLLSTQANPFPWIFATPLTILFTMEGIATRPRMHRLAAWMALVCLAHVLSGLIVLLCVSTARVIVHGWRRRAFDGHLRYAVAVGVGLALSGYYLYPAVTQQSLVNPTAWTHTADWLDWHSRFLFATFSYWLNGMSWFALQWLIPALFMLLAVLTLAIARREATVGSDDDRVVVVRRLAIVGIVALLFGSELGYPLWSFGTPIRMIQQPYRFVVLASICIGFAYALLVARAGVGMFSGVVRIASLAVAAAIVAYACTLQFGLYRYGEVSPTAAAAMTGDFSQAEYLPATHGERYDAYNAAGGLRGECARLDVRCEIEKPMTQSFRARIEAATAVGVRMPVFAFPGWRTNVDGRSSTTTIDPGTGLIRVPIEAGAHLVEIDWVGVPAERVGRILTMAGALAYALLFGLAMRTARRGSS